MRVGIDCRLWNETGVGRYTRNLVSELLKIDKKNDYVLFVLPEDIENVKFQMSNFKCKIKEVDIRWHTIGEQLEFPKILDKEKLDLVHFPYFSVPIFYRKPYIVTIHDLILHHFPTGQASTLPYPLYRLKLAAYYFAIAQAAKQAKMILSVSAATKQEIVDHLKITDSKIVVTHEGVDENLFIKNQKKEDALFTNYFLYIGNAYPHKNLNRLIDAFIQIRKKNPDTKLILTGKEDYFYKRLKKYIPQGSNVIFYGHATDTELASLLQHAHALVQPSLMEGFGLPPLEAMANRCLVLASKIPSLVEVCQDNALYFDPFKTSEIVDTMQAVLSERKQYTKQIENAYRFAQTFSWKEMATRTLEVYNRCFVAETK